MYCEPDSKAGVGLESDSKMFIDPVQTAIQKQCSNKITYSSNYKIIFHFCCSVTRNFVENNINVILSKYNLGK